MECGMKLIKCLLFVFNFVFVISGIALIAVGAIAHSSGKEYTVFLGSKYVTAPTLLIVVGSIIFFIAFFGCWGAVKENSTMVTTFAVLLFIVFVIEIAGGIAAYVYRNQLGDLIKESMEETIKQHKPDALKIWEEIQYKKKCCGVDGPDDWEKNKLPIPPSCCGSKIVNDTCTSIASYKTGCYEEFKADVESKIAMVGGAGVGIAFIEILGIVFACCLSSAIKKEYEGV